MLLLEVCEQEYFWRQSARITSEKTRHQYRVALRCFGRHLGHSPALADLDDDAVTKWMAALLTKGLAVVTVRERIGRIIALWTWLAKRRVVLNFPTVAKPPAPEPLPQALSESQLRALFESAAKERGSVDGIPAALWWVGLFAFIFSTGERKTAALALRLDWIDLQAGIAKIPPKHRKGGRKWGVYHLWPEVVDLLGRLIAAQPHRELIWPHSFCEGTLYHRLKRILKDAGIPTGRSYKLHALRVSHATHLKALGGDATRSLGHSDAATTNRHYIDPTKIPAVPNLLFCPWKNTP